MIARLKPRVQYLKTPVEVLYRGGLASNQSFHYSLNVIGRYVMIEPHKLGEYPIQNRRDECCVLEVWVDSVGEMSCVSFVSYIVNHSQGPGYMQSHSIWLGGRRQVGQGVH